MEFLKYAVLALLAVTAFIILIIALRCSKPLKIITMNAIFGIGVMIIINLTARYSGTYIPINLYTVIGSAVFGLPAICAFLVLNLIFL